MNCARDLTEYPEYVEESTALSPRLILVASGVKRRRTRRKSFLKSVETALFSIAAGGLLWLGGSSVIHSLQASAQPSQMSTVKMMVEPGDTLWRIAGRLNADGEQQVDVVNDIRSLNPGLSSSGAIIAGQAIIVPVNRGTVNPDLHLAKVDTGVEHSM